jgi:hypothetical protein
VAAVNLAAGTMTVREKYFLEDEYREAVTGPIGPPWKFKQR